MRWGAWSVARHMLPIPGPFHVQIGEESGALNAYVRYQADMVGTCNARQVCVNFLNNCCRRGPGLQRWLVGLDETRTAAVARLLGCVALIVTLLEVSGKGLDANQHFDIRV